MSTLLFEDAKVDQLAPASTGRPAFAIRCGGVRLVDLADRLPGPKQLAVRPFMQATVDADFVAPPTEAGEAALSGHRLCLNARLAPSLALIEQLESIVAADQPCRVRQGGEIAAALLPQSMALPDPLTGEAVAQFLRDADLEEIELDLPLFDWPHQIIQHHVTNLTENLVERIRRGNYQEIESGVFAAPQVEIHPHTVSDTEQGPIVLEENVQIGAGSYLTGPLYLEANTQVAPHAFLRGGVTAGTTCKLGGEIEASIFESYANKCHHGYLGHSYLGSWVNFGAGTSCSNLKNTYGKITMIYGDQRVATDMQFCGCFVGNYAKTAINASIFTGKTIGVASMVYGEVTSNIPAFVNYVGRTRSMTEVSLEVALTMQERMFARRQVPQRDCDVALLDAMFQQSAPQRIVDGRPLTAAPPTF